MRNTQKKVGNCHSLSSWPLKKKKPRAPLAGYHSSNDHGLPGDFTALLSPPSSGFEGHCQMELRFLPSVTHQQDSYLLSIPALMQRYGAKQGSGCLREQISEPSFHWTLQGCWKLKMERDLLGHLDFAPLAQSSHDHLHSTETLNTPLAPRHPPRAPHPGRNQIRHWQLT